MRKVLVAAIAASAMLLVPGSALAQDPPAEDPVPPAFAPPVVSEVVDVASAEAFIEAYADRNAGRFLGESRRRVRVLDVNAACLQHPVTLTRFGCVFTLRALTIQRRHGWWHWGHGSKARAVKSGGRKHRPRFRIRTFGCLGLARVDGGVGVTPTVNVPLFDCQRVPRGDMTAPEPEPVVAP